MDKNAQSHGNNIQAPSFEKLGAHKKDIECLFAEYGSVLAPKIVEYEVEQCLFPVEVLNEIRSIYAHLYRASVSERIEDTASNIAKARSHSKRAALDCYKYLCVAYDERYHKFFDRFNYINWDKSGFSEDILGIDRTRQLAVKMLQEAKTRESTEGASGEGHRSNEYINDYRDAYDKYKALMDMIADLEEKVVNGQSIVSRVPVKLLILLGMGGIIIGLIIGLLI